MKVELNPDIDYQNKIRAALRNNENYCPCVPNSKGKQEYRCLCKDFRDNVPVGEYCHCGLYKKLDD